MNFFQLGFYFWVIFSQPRFKRIWLIGGSQSNLWYSNMATTRGLHCTADARFYVHIIAALRVMLLKDSLFSKHQT